MYKLVTVPENRYFGKKDRAKTNNDEKVVIFRNVSSEHTAVIAHDFQTGMSVELLLRKDAIPKWVNTENKD